MSQVISQNQETISAGSLILRPLQISDQAYIELYASDQRVATMTRDLPHPMPPGLSEAIIDRARDEQHPTTFWALDLGQDSTAQLSGLISLTPVAEGRGEVSFWIAPAFWNAGLATMALRALIGANPHGDTTYFAQVFQDNPASARVLSKLEFTYLGDAEEYSVARRALVPTWTYLRKLD